jgi:O-antigen/teichoic acid export membrane protein
LILTGGQTGTAAREAAPTSSGPARQLRALRGPLRSVWRRHSDVLGNAGSLLAATGVTSLLGLGYWTLAARLLSQQAVGYGSAAVSAMTLLGTIGMLGLGTVLIGELPRRTARGGLISAALIACGLGSLVLGLGFAVVAPHVSARFVNIAGTPSRAALFTAGVVLTTVSMVFDQATIGLMRAGTQLFRNIVFAVAKLLALPTGAIMLHDLFGVGITASWVAGMGLSLVSVAVWLRCTGTHVLPRPDWGVLRGLGRTAIAHNWLNLAIIVPFTLLPVVVTIIVSPAANAAFYVAWTLVGVLYVLPAHLSMVLFAIVAADPQVIARKLRFTLRLSLLIGLPGMAVLGFGAHLILGIFGAKYAHMATFPLWMLVIGYLPTIPRAHYIAVCRAVNRVPWAAFVLSAAAIAEVGGAAAGGAAGGLRGLSIALTVVTFAEGLAFAPPVLRAAMGYGRHRRGAPLSGITEDRRRGARPAMVPAGHSAELAVTERSHGARNTAQDQGSAEIDKRESQLAGINVLLSLASSAASTGYSPVLPARLASQAGIPDLPAAVGRVAPAIPLSGDRGQRIDDSHSAAQANRLA